MTNSHIKIKDIFTPLQGTDYAILRNHKKLASEKKINGDVDLIIKKKDLENFRNALKDNLEVNIKIFEIFNHGIRLILFKENPWFFLKLDVHFYESFKGIEIISAEDLLDNSLDYMFLSVISDLDEALIHAFRLFQWGKIKEKDFVFIKKIYETKNQEFKKKLNKYFGKSFLKYLENVIVDCKPARLNIFQKISIILYLFRRKKFMNLFKIIKHYFFTCNNFIQNVFIEHKIAKDSKFNHVKPALEEFLKLKFPGVIFNVQNKQSKISTYNFKYRFYDINIFLSTLNSSDMTSKDIIKKLDDKLVNHLHNMKDF